MPLNIADDPKEMVNGFVMVNAAVAKSINNRLQLQAGIENIFDHSSEAELVDVYSAIGLRIRSKLKREQSTTGLSNGVYIVGGKKIIVTNN